MRHMQVHPLLHNNNVHCTLGVRNGKIVSGGHIVTIFMNALSRELETFLVSLARRNQHPLG
jgi:hypothetical protein